MQKIFNRIDVIVGEGSDGHAELAKASLQELGIVNNLYRGRNGDETLALVRHACRRGKAAVDVPLLVVLDCGLSFVDGVDVLRALKGDRRYSWIPVIMMTGVDDREQAERCRRLRCEAYITKWTVFLGLPGFVRKVRFLAGRAICIASRRRSVGLSHGDCAGALGRWFISTASPRDHPRQQLNGKEVSDESGAA